MKLNRAMGARDLGGPHGIRVRALLLDARRGDRFRAAALLGEAAALAERIGMPALLGRIRALGRRAPRRPAVLPTACRRARCRSSGSSPRG